MDSKSNENFYSNSRAYAPESSDYEFFFEYLRLSPSYKLALADLDPKEPPVTADVWYPKDFNTVRQTARDTGDISNLSFETWWKKRGILMFGQRGAKPRSRVILVIPRETKNPSSVLEAKARSLYSPDYRSDGELFFAEFPNGASRTEMISVVDRIQQEMRTLPKLVNEAKYKLEVNKVNRRTLVLGLKALDLFQNTNLELWRIGAEIGMSETLKDALDPNGPKINKDLYDQKKSMTAMVARLLKKAKNLSENAARGVFPCVNEPAFGATFTRPKDRKT